MSVALEGGGGYGTPPHQMMSSVHIVIQNNSKYDVVVKSVTFDEALTPQEPLPAGIRIPACETFLQMVNIEDVPGDEDELSGRPMSRFTAHMSYRLNGSDWRRSSGDNPQYSSLPFH